MTIQLQTLGPPRCFADGALIDMSGQKLRFALLAHLAVERRVAREPLATLFWPERNEEKARHTLAQTIYELRRSLGDDWLEGQADPLQATSALTTDAAQFEELVERGELAAALGVYQGEFLEGFHLKGSNEFNSWIEGKRRELKRLHHRACREHLKALITANDYERAIAHVHAWIESDPLDDEANHALIDLLANTGRRADALAHYRTYEAGLKAELDVAPLEQTQQLIATMQAQPPGIELGAGATPTEFMSAPNREPRGWVGELTRRRVFRMAGWYAGAVFLTIQVAQVLTEAFYLPPAVLTITALLGLVGFPLALLLSWQFDITPDGIQRTVRHGTAGAHFDAPSWRLVAAALAIIFLAGAAALSTTRAGDVLMGMSDTPDVECEDGSHAPCIGEVPIVANRFAVLPLSHQTGVEPGLLDGELCARLLADGLSHWRDINLADHMRVNDALRRLPHDVRTHLPVDTGVAIARRVGAGKLIMGELWHHGDSTRVNASLYDVASGQLLKQRPARFASGTADAGKEFYRLAQLLLLDDGDIDLPTPIADATTSYAALFAFNAANKAIDEWKLAEASQHFKTALRRDSDYGYAHLWLAHVMLWQADTTAEWRHHAERAAAAANTFGGVDSLLASGIAQLAKRKYAAACETYRELLARDAENFHAWYGLSECLAGDDRVVRDASSPSGWSFVTSREEAIRAHQHALLLVPSFNQAFTNLGSSRLGSLLYLDANEFRAGHSEADSSRFAATPELMADTIAFVPYPQEEWSRRPSPVTNSLVIARHRAIMRQVAETWARAFPNNTRALRALAAAAEQTGMLTAAQHSNSAVEMIRRAYKLEPDSATRLSLQVAEVRLLFKAGEYKHARKLATRVLKQNPRPTPAQAQGLAGLAGLVGQPHRMGRYLADGANAIDFDLPVSGEQVAVPLEMARTVGRLLAYTYADAPRDSLQPLIRRAHEQLRLAPEPDRQALHQATLDRVARMAFATIGADEVHGSASGAGMIPVQSLLLRADTPAVRAELERRRQLRVGARPTDVAADGVLLQAQLGLAIGDTTGTVRIVDAYLNDLANMPPSHFRQPYQPVSVVRLMALRAELAAQQSDRAAARRWSRAVIDLWWDADEELKPAVRRMRRLARF